MWSVFVIMGAYFFTRSILMCIRSLEGKATYWAGARRRRRGHHPIRGAAPGLPPLPPVPPLNTAATALPCRHRD